MYLSFKMQFVNFVLGYFKLFRTSQKAKGFFRVLFDIDGDIVVRAQGRTAIIVHVALVRNREVWAVGRAIDGSPSSIGRNRVVQLVSFDGKDEIVVERKQKRCGCWVANELLLFGVEPLRRRESTEDVSLLGFGDHQSVGVSGTGLLEQGALKIILAGSIQQSCMGYPLVLLREDDPEFFDLPSREHRRQLLENGPQIECISLGCFPKLEILANDLIVFLEEGDPAGTELLQGQDGSTGVGYFLQLEDAVVAYSSNVLLDELEIFHPLHNFIFLLQASFNGTGIDLFFEDELDVITGVVLTIAYEIEVVQRADQTDSELLELPVDAILELPEGNVELDVVELVEADYFYGVQVESLL